MASNQYEANPSWMGMGRSSSQYDTGQTRHIDPGAAFLGEIFFALFLTCVNIVCTLMQTRHDTT